MVQEVFVLFTLIVLSGFFSASELAFVVSNKIKIEIRARKNQFSAKTAFYFLKKPEIFFSTILISNNVVNMSFASLITIFLVAKFGMSDFHVLLVSTVILLFFGELIPKYIAREMADSFVTVSAIPVRILSIAFYPIVKVTSSISSLLTSTKKIDSESAMQLFDKTDIKDLLDESSEAGNVREEEYDLISRVMDLKDQRIYETITPRTEIVGIDITSSINEVIDVFVQSGYSKLPVYEDNLDNIKGMVYINDIFTNPRDLKSMLREVNFVPDTKKSLDMLNEFLDKRISIAVVIDEFGGTAGIVTVEDILEEMLGDIKDEYDTDEAVCKRTDENTYVISGKVEIDYINEEFDLRIPEGDYETIGGYLTYKTGRIPLKGEILNLDHFKIVILSSNRTRVELVKLWADPEKLEEYLHG